MDEEAQLKEMQRLERAIKREGTAAEKSPRRAVVYQDEQLKDFSNSEKDLIKKASESFIDDDSDDEIEEEIAILPVTPAVEHRNVAVLQDDEKALREQKAARERAEQAEREKKAAEEEKKKEAESEAQKLSQALKATTDRREQEQLSLQAKMRAEKEQIEREREFAEKALQVAAKASSAPKSQPMRVCARCDKQTPMNNSKCQECGFQGSLFGGLAF